MIQPRKGAVLLIPTLVTRGLSNAVSQSSSSPRGHLSNRDIGNSLMQAKNPVAALIIDLLGIVVGPTVSVGLTCSSISAVGGGRRSW